MKYIKYTLIALSIFLTNCATEEEKEARRQNAFDLSGTYQTTEDSSDVQFEFTITNQNGNHDISAKVRRTDPLLPKEIQFLTSEKAKNHFTTFSTHHPFPTSFGAESNFLEELLAKLFEGAENISKDLGKTSQFYICSDKPTEYTNTSNKPGEEPKTITLKFYYCLSGTVRKENKNVIENGVLSLGSWSSDPTKNEDGEGVVLNYKAEKVTSN